MLDITDLFTVLDDAVGEVVDTLTAKGMLDNTVIIFSSDNGGSNSQGASNYPLRGQKATYFQGGINICVLLFTITTIIILLLLFLA